MTAPLAWTIELAFVPQRSQMLFLAGITKWTKLMQYLQGSKKRNGGSNRNLNGESAKETMLSEMRVSGYDRLLLLVVVLYTLVGYWERQRSACGTSAEQSAVYLQSAKKNIVTVFHSVKAARHGGFWVFHPWGQINNYGESSIMTCRRKMLGYIFWKRGSSKANCA